MSNPSVAIIFQFGITLGFALIYSRIQFCRVSIFSKSSSVNKLSIYLSLKVPELWRYNGQDLKFYQLVEEQYIECDFIITFPIVSVRDINQFIEQSKTRGEIAFLKLFRAWVREKIK